MSIAVHIDCDPGQDDAIAILYALGSGLADIVSISVVGGNADVNKCARNALQITELSGHADIPVYRGAAAPLKRLLQPLPAVFGESGMAGAEHLPDPSRPCEPQQAVERLLDLPAGTGIVALGPLTNLALALQKDASFAQRMGRLVVMGGCAFPEPLHGWMGNYKAPDALDYAEYNFAVDPEAAKIVFDAGIADISMIGVDITRGVLYNKALDTRLRAGGARCAVTAADILATVGAEDRDDYADVKTSPDDPVRGIHDVVAMGFALRPDLFESRLLPVRISIDDANAGQTIVDETSYDQKQVRVITDLDKPAFLDDMIQAIARLP